jgi:lycopene cyclase domain-containing protein
VLGPRLFGLPFEELLFFLCIPFSCLFIYDTLTKFPRLALPEKPVRIAAGLLGLALFVLSVLNASRAYTTLCFMVAAPLLFAIAGGHLGRRAGHLATAWLIQLVPFLLVNGVLTALPVVWYNNAENLGLRLGSIPVEDFAYSMILLFGGVFVLETKAWKDPP